MPGASNISKFLDGNSLRAIKTYVDGKSGSIPNEFIDSAFMGGPSIDYTEDFATLYPIPDTLSDADGTHRVLFSETQLREVAGNSVVLKQLLTGSGTNETKDGITFTHNGDGTISVVGTATATTNHYFSGPTGGLLANHKYLLKGCPAGGSANSYSLNCSGNLYDRGNGFIATIASNQTPSCRIEIYNGITINATFRPQLFDLTLMGLDSITTVEEFNRIFPNDYYPYNAGEIRNTTASGIKVNGYNAFDGELFGGYWDANTGVKTINSNFVGSNDYIKVIQGQTYNLEIENNPNIFRNILGYDINKNFIRRFATPRSNSTTITIPNNVCYITFYYENTQGNVCLHLTGYRTGYAPYKEPKAISFASTELLGAGEAHDTIEVVEGDMVAGIQRYNLVHVKRIGTVDLGTFTWAYGITSKRFISDNMMNIIKRNTSYTKISNLVCSKYEVCSPYTMEQVESTDKAVAIGGNGYSVTIKDSSYTDATAFKTAMSGVILNYELATPTRTTIAENLTFEDVSATIEQGGSIETLYETLAPNCTTGFAVDKDVIIQEGRYLDENGLYTLVSNISNRYVLKSSIGGTITDTYINSLF